jgi:thiamine-phosphate pyrophosphorylase
MLFVISDPMMHSDDAVLLNALFDEGMEVFHLRKPSAAAPEIQHLLEKITQDHYAKIALHHHHELAERFGIKRLHYTEERRKKTDAKEWSLLKEQGFHLSTSIHQIEEASTISDQFDYAFFGPVFNSISKKGYMATVTENFIVPGKKTKLVAIGGIDENNVSMPLQKGFDGVAVLGAIWQSSDPVKSFKQIKKACSPIVR